MWLLEQGLVRAGELCAPELPAEAVEEVPETDTLVLRFSGTADGRGFSAARQLRAGGFTGRLLAAGPLIPDQARHALQSGFDGVLIEDAAMARQGRDAWARAAQRARRPLYVSDPTSGAVEASIWTSRHSQ